MADIATFYVSRQRSKIEGLSFGLPIAVAMIANRQLDNIQSDAAFRFPASISFRNRCAVIPVAIVAGRASQAYDFIGSQFGFSAL